MGKMKRDFKDTEVREPGEGYQGDQPKSGRLYPAKLVSCKEHTAEDSTEWVFELVESEAATKDNCVGWRGWVYTNTDGAAWKEAQIFYALGITKELNGKVDESHESVQRKAGECRVKVRLEPYNEEMRAKITSILGPEGGSKPKEKKKKKSASPA